MHVVYHAFFGMMGESGAIPGTNFINAAHIGGKIKELAGPRFVHPIVLTLVQVQIFFPELQPRHVQVSGNARDVFGSKGGRHGLATIRAAKAINLLPYCFVKSNACFVQLLGRIFFNGSKESSELSFVVANLHSE